ncbi:Inter-alpha-trypsin inhibitor heavy chain [Heracleum sosnowskyi]|uniref:Inter-alpha-trypsin inhibitor heavy chain n=1 Tax=Heracleum sosnowskyi TaxID=360622 RepID=A0AAD8M923_9APIA|nr:Inter-alpha-trypsin inhibitor heavy chain [Heracleum sosnowskyi]
MAEEFVKAVEDGIRLSKRIYFGKDRSVAPPKPMPAMDKSSHSYLPSSPMVYAVIPDPAVVDNPDIPSYQPHVHGRCDPPALIPLQMNSVCLEADCVLDTAFVSLSGSWRVHCVMGTRFVDCRVAIPMGEQGSILGVEVEVPRKSYSTKVVTLDHKDMENEPKLEDGGFIKPQIFTFTIPEIDGGSNLSIKVRWSQKLLYQDGQYTLTVPYTFPEYVTPAGKKMAKKERIKVNLNAGPGTGIVCKTISHPLKELRRNGGQLGFLYDTGVLTWSSCDFVITYSVSVSPSGGVILQSPSMIDIDQREMFCLSLFPGNKHKRKVFRKEVLFVIDISESMLGKPLEDTKNALVAALLKLDQGDSFNIIAFNDEIHLFSSSLELATEKTLDKVTEWMSTNLVAQGGTNMLLPLNQALQMISNTHNGTPIIFLITDGAVENERHICDVMMSHLSNEKLTRPRLHTFGIGSFCNHYFLQFLATMGKGSCDAAYDEDSIEVRMKGFFNRAFSTIVQNITIDGLENLDDLEMYPSCIPDLLSERPVIITGRYSGDFPSTVQLKGVLADMSNFSVDLKVEEVKEMPIDKILAKQQIELCTAQAWFSEDKGLEEEIAKVSVQNSVISEYTCMVLLETDKGKKRKTDSAEKGKGKKGASRSSEKKEKKQVSTEPDCQKRTVLHNFKYGFGNLTATIENTPPGSNEDRLPDPGEKFVMAASNCCSKMCGHCCCLCCIQMCSRVNDQCAIVFTQLCSALSCLGCYYCWEACCGSE